MYKKLKNSVALKKKNSDSHKDRKDNLLLNNVKELESTMLIVLAAEMVDLVLAYPERLVECLNTDKTSFSISLLRFI